MDPKTLFGKALDLLRGRKRAYQDTFTNPVGQIVLSDLLKYCRVLSNNFDADPRVHAYYEGRRDVALRILHHLNLPSQTLYKMYDAARAANLVKED
jgi:hypothetical protein